MYKREPIGYDTDYVKRYDESLNTTLIFVRRSSSSLINHLTCSHRRACSLPSAPLSSLVSIRTSSPIRTTNPARDPPLNQSAIPGETPPVPSVQEDSPGEIVTITVIMYASLLISLLDAFIAMLGKQLG